MEKAGCTTDGKADLPADHDLSAQPLKTFVSVRGVSAIAHIYPSALQAVPGHGRTERLEGGLQGYLGGAMQDLGYELPRICIPRTQVNKGKREGRGCYAPAPLLTNTNSSCTHPDGDCWRHHPR